MTDKLDYERKALKKGYRTIVGIDEAGRGPLAGPVVAAACHLGQEVNIPGIEDSKKLTSLKREKLYEALTNHPSVSFGVGFVNAEVIDKVNILQATILAMLEAVENITVVPDYLLVDGLKLPSTIPSEKIIKGDSHSISIGAASIIAKVVRDRWMCQADRDHPEYGFKRHMGYGTKKHMEALEKYGPCPIHRMSFAPVQRVR